jgi:hypothetical protein
MIPVHTYAGMLNESLNLGVSTSSNLAYYCHELSYQHFYLWTILDVLSLSVNLNVLLFN